MSVDITLDDPRLLDFCERLVPTGLFGDSADDAACYLIRRGLQDMAGHEAWRKVLFPKDQPNE